MEGTTGYESKVEFFLGGSYHSFALHLPSSKSEFCESSVLCKGSLPSGQGQALVIGLALVCTIWCLGGLFLVSLSLNFCIYKMKKLNLMLFLLGILIMPCNCRLLLFKKVILVMVLT